MTHSSSNMAAKARLPIHWHALAALGAVVSTIVARSSPVLRMVVDIRASWTTLHIVTLLLAMGVAVAITVRLLPLRHITPVLCTALIAMGWTGWRIADYQYRLIDDDSEPRLLADITVRSIPNRDGAEYTFAADVTAVNNADIHGPLRLQLRWNNGPAVHAGERWRLMLELAPPVDARNPGGGIFVAQSLRAGLHGSARVIQSALNRQLQSVRWSIDRTRESLAEFIRDSVVERDASALLVALAVGDTNEVSREQWRVFNAVGITHLVAISGLHVTLFSAMAAFCARRLWSRLPIVPLLVRRESFAAAVGISFALGYALLAGFSVPAQRTLLMLATWHVLRGLARPQAAASPLPVAMLLVLCLDPLAPLAAGFWLSFVAVGVLLYGIGAVALPTVAQPLWRRTVQAVAELWRAQWRVALGLLPVTVAVFGSVSVAGLLVNLFAIPLFSFGLVPLVLFSLPLQSLWPDAAQFLLHLAASIHMVCWPWLVAAADWSLALWRLAPMPVWFVLALPLLLILLLPWHWPQRFSAVLALIPAIWPPLNLLGAGEFQATVLDAGRGLAVVVQTAHHALLFDNAERWGSAGAISRNVVLPALRALHVRQLHRLIVPALDQDRAAGLTVLAAELDIVQWQTGGRRAELPPEFTVCAAGERWNWDGVWFESLADGQCVLRLTSAYDQSFLITGDLDIAHQRELVAAGLRPAEVVLVPKHGAATGFLAEFRDACSARWAVLAQSSRGARSATVAATTAAWRAGGATVLVTADSGAVNIRVSHSLQVSSPY